MLDPIDLQIIKILYNNSLRTWKLMKMIYPAGDDTEHNRVVAKIKKMVKYGIILNNKNTYCLVQDYVKFSKNKFPDGIKNSIALFLEGRWVIFSH